MTKKLFLKLGLFFLLSLSFISCGKKNNSPGEDNSSKLNISNPQSSVKKSVETSSDESAIKSKQQNKGVKKDSIEKDNSSKSSARQFVSNTQSSAKESIKTILPTDENEVKSKSQNKSVEKNIPQDIQPDTQEYSTENGVFIVTRYNTVRDVCEFNLAGIYVTPKIEPLNNSGIYSHIDVQNKDNVYIDVIIDVKNLNNEAKLTGDLIDAKIKIKNTEYTCFSIAEISDNTDLEGNASINPLETREVHYVAEVPKTEATGEIEVTLTINGKNYSNKFLLEC